MSKPFQLTLAALLLSTTAPALATAADDAAADAVAAAGGEEPIVITGQRPEYGARQTSTATRTNTPLRNIPQALTVISESQIEDQDLRSIADVLTFVPGAMPGTGESNRDQITLRGNNSTADFFVDGIRDDVQYFRDLYNVDRVEVLRGPNAMIFGRGGGGGIVNRVIKRSSLGGAYREFRASGDSQGGARLTADFDQPLGGAGGLRVAGVYENGESFRDFVELERYGINPTAGFLAGANTRFDVGYEYVRDRRTTDRGVPSDGDRPLEGFERTFFGDPEDSFARSQVHIARAGIEHDFGGGLTLRNRTLYGDYAKFYQNIYPSNLDEETRVVSFGAYNNRNDRKNLFSQTDLVWENRLGGIDQTLLVGFELGRQKSRNHRQSGIFAPGDNSAPLSDPTVDRDVTFASSASDANNRVTADVAALYVQDQIRISPLFEIVAGVRVDRFKLSLDDLRVANTDVARTDTMVSPRLGLIAKPQDNLSVYASFSRSFLPQSGDQFSGLNLTTDVLKPERFDNLELGAKWEPVEGLLASAAVYQLDRTNTRAPSPDGSGATVLTGEQRSRGLELGLERSISDRWQVSAGYALQKSEIRQRTSSCNPAVAQCEVPLVPRHQFSLWNRFELSDALGLGLGIVARSKAYASISNSVALPGYARVDGAVFYQLARGIQAQVNVENLLNEDYFSTAHSDNNIAPGAPRTARATVRFGF